MVTNYTEWKAAVAAEHKKQAVKKPAAKTPTKVKTEQAAKAPKDAATPAA